jgi:RHH-type proline utilization regulon transcriptional repressor/proline dehydrogenase/delta 1-pyrroline-5-carboxylate dehydrogenase
MKPAEQSAVVGAKFMEVLEEAGFPPGVVNLLKGVGEEIGPTLTNHPDVSIIAFTGSRPVGLAIQKQAAETPDIQHHLKRVITEMGGKNAVIIDDDADLDEAVHAVVASAFGYAGQKCSAASRVIVLTSIYDQFLTRLIEATKSLKIGPAADPANSVGPVIDEDAHRRIFTSIDRAKAQGIRLAHPAPSIGNPQSAIGNEGFYVEPHIFTDVPPDSDLAQNEIFGPVLAVLRAKDLTDALTIANNTKYALTGGCFSRSPSTLDRVKRDFRVGNLYLNRKITGALVERQPFGGYKLSGIGTKAGGPDYLLQFLDPRVVTENTMRQGFAPTGE